MFMFFPTRTRRHIATRAIPRVPQLHRIFGLLSTSSPLSPSSRPAHTRRRSPSLPMQPAPVITPELLPFEKHIDEEQLPGYDSRNYYPANPGDVVDSRYELVAKLGWGSDSTVWLAKVISSDAPCTERNYVAIKFCSSDIAGLEKWLEAEMNMHLATMKPEHQGRGALATAFEAFEILSPRGRTHLALVLEPLREPLWLFKRRLDNQRSTSRSKRLPLIKTYIQILLEGLNYMHSQCRVVHTDLKLDNIMLTFESQSTIKTFVDEQNAQPMARKVFDDHIVYRCHNDFGPILKGLGNMLPNITDFGLAHRCEAPVLFYPIQPDAYRAPEVLLGYGWSFSADIWNFGLVVWELLTGRSLFSTPGTPYNAAQHLADMIALLGDVPADILRRERDLRYHKWPFQARNMAGKLCDNATDFYGGPFFFDDEGRFLHNGLIPRSRNLESEVPDFLQSEGELFLSFMRRMLCWTPQERATADDLVDDPWLGPCRWK